MNKRLIKGLVLLSLTTLAACTDSEETGKIESVDQENNSEQTSGQAQYILPQGLNIQKVSIRFGTEEFSLNYKGSEWESTGLEDLDSASVSLFVEDLLNIVGTPVEVDIEAETEITLFDGDDSIDITLGKEDQQYIQVDEQVFEYEDLPLALNPYDSAFLQDSFELGIDGLKDIRFVRDGETVKLSQTTAMNEVEKLPFISGWYLNDVYETDFSIEYYWMNTLFSQLTELKATQTDDVSGPSTQQIILSNGELEEVLHVGEEEENGRTLVYIENQDETLSVPTQITELFQFEPLEIVDNFVALIPLDAVETVNINTPEKDYTIRVDRLVDENSDGAEISSTFYLNDEEIEESVFRRAYQYLARLSYSQPLTPEEKQQIDGEDAIDITFDYLLEGETVRKEVVLTPLENSKEYSVTNDGVMEFKMTDEKLKELFDAFDDLDN